ncbi:hypothetical protein [Fusibacter bizertensis]
MIDYSGRFRYYLKLNFFSVLSNKAAIISLLIAFFVFFTVIDLHAYTSEYVVYQVDRDVSNRTLMIDLNQDVLSHERMDEPNSLLSKLINMPMVESYDVVDFDEMGNFLRLQLSSYLKINAFDKVVRQLDAEIRVEHHFTSRYDQITKINFFILMLYLLAIMLSLGLLGYFCYREYRGILSTLNLMNYIGYKLANLLVFLYCKVLSVSIIGGSLALLLERFFIRNILLKIISNKFEFSMTKYVAVQYYLVLFALLTLITFIYFLKGVRHDFTTLEN